MDLVLYLMEKQSGRFTCVHVFLQTAHSMYVLIVLFRAEAARESVLQRQREGLLRGGLPGKSPALLA